MTNRTVEVDVSIDLLRSVLGIPDAVDIHAAHVDSKTRSLRLIVSHPVFDEVTEGQIPPHAAMETCTVGTDDRPRWARARMVHGAINVNGADLLLIETMVVRKG